jgi:glycosyltransferase involved in cell wall biosynthesis
VSRIVGATSHVSTTATAAFLWANNRLYESLVERLHEPVLKDAHGANEVLGRVTKAASFAAAFHTGRFADGAIENVALLAGVGLNDLSMPFTRIVVPRVGRTPLRRVLHVASHIRSIGGHSRMLYNWVHNDRSSCHSLVVTNQRDIPVPRWMPDAVKNSAGAFLVLPSEWPFLLKASCVREMARQNAYLIVLHHDASDLVPTVAFAVSDCPPVAILNHADHQFWLGSSVSDVVINLRTAGAEHTAERRFVSSNVVIPIPLDQRETSPSRLDARRAVGIPEQQVVLLSVGRAEKYRPCGPYDFIKTAGKILDRRPEAHLYIVGESPVGITPYLRCTIHDRLHFLGPIADPSLYRAAADIYIESFPFGSQTALLEAALGGLPVVTAYAPMFPLLVANDDAINDLVQNPCDEDEYLAQVDLLVELGSRRVELGALLRGRLQAEHVGNGWLQRLATVYGATDLLSHRPGSIPDAHCSTTAADVSLSLWHAMADGKTYTTGAQETGYVGLLRHSASIAKYSGDYHSARRDAWRAVWHAPGERASWRLLATTVLGKSGGHIRRMIG